MASVYVNHATSAPARIPVWECRPPTVASILGAFTPDGFAQYRRFVMRNSRFPGCENYSVKFAAQLLERAIAVASDFSGPITPYICALAAHDLRRDEYEAAND